MAPSTRSTPRGHPIPSMDTEMEEAYQPLALPAPHAPEWADQETTQAIQPIYHPEPTL